MKRYYSINNKDSVNDSKYLGISFVIVSGNEIKHIAGDKSLTRKVESSNGNLMQKHPKDNLNITRMGELQFEACKERYLITLKGRKE